MLKVLLAALSLQIVLHSVECFHPLAARAVTDLGTEICIQQPIELGIVLDSSSSIPAKDFQRAKDFLENFVSNFDIGPNAVRISIITYGYGIYPADGFNLTTYNTKEDVKAAIGRIPHRAGLRTDTGRAIEYMHRVQLSDDVTRSIADKFALVITDGNSQEWRFTKQAAEEARDADITILAVGVGSGVREAELLNIAGNITNVIKVDSYEKLPSVIELLASRTCIPKPTTTPEPKAQQCGELNPSDIYFVFSPAGLGPDATSWTTSFISNAISSEDLSVGFQYGVVSGSCPDDEGFDLNAYNTVQQYKERLNSYVSRKLPELVERVINGGYSPERGGRPGARKVAVIVIDRSKSSEDLISHVQRLRDSGVTVFLADPTGEGVEIEGAVTLNGRSAREQADTLTTLLCPQ